LMSEETKALLAKPPTIEKIDVLAAKLPGKAASSRPAA
jgi:hypothetical protein